MSRSSSLDVNVPLLRTDARSRSRPRGSRHSTSNSVPTIIYGPEDIINPTAPINEEDAELLHEFLHPHHHHAIEETLVQTTDGPSSEDEGEEEASDNEWMQKLPWWRRPSPWWFLSYVPFAAIAMSITAAAKIELFTYLVCQAHRPVFDPDGQGGVLISRIAEDVASSFADPSQRGCAHDPIVQATVARLTVIMTTTMGILTCLTTAWWGSLSDRYGRTRVLSCAIVGVLLMDMNFLCVFWFYDYIPGGYWFLILGPLVEGFLGGQALVGATIHAYISDCTPPARRSGLFSLYLGLMFTGVGIGPTLGGLVIRFTDKFINVFYISAILHGIYALLVWLVIPESLLPSQMLEARARHKLSNEEYRSARVHGGILVFFKRLFSFLTPLSIFLPVDLNGGNPAKGKRRDWSLLLVIVTYGFVCSLVGLYLYVIQYLTGVYSWNTEQVGYWFSSVGAARAIFLTAILPTIIRLTKPRAPIQLPTEPDEPLTSPTSPSFTAPSPSRESSPAMPAPHSSQFDLRLAQVSVGIEVVTYTLMVCSTSGLMFAGVTAVGAFGMGFAPAIQAVALALYNGRGGKDSGKLFGAMSVVQAMSSQVFGPFVYGLTYARTVGTFPQTIFVMASGAVTIAFILLLFVRLPHQGIAVPGDVEEQEASVPHIEREDTLVELPEPLIVVEDEDRGRKVVKP